MFLSIIIPVYNTEKYLAECLDSCLHQDIPYSEYEIICVNDGSTDGSAAILDTYKEHYDNITVIHKENGGVCVARNIGIDTAKGDYIWFVDADDFIQRNILAYLKKTVEKTAFDRIKFPVYEFINELTFDEQKKYQDGCLPPSLAHENTVVWNSLFCRRTILHNNLNFYHIKSGFDNLPNVVLGEDTLFIYRFLRNHPTETIIKNQPLYFYRRNSQSQTGNYSTDMQFAKMNCLVQLAVYLKSDYELLKKNADSYAINAANCLMVFLRGALAYIAQMPYPEYKKAVKLVKDNGLFPFKQPPECTYTWQECANEPNGTGKLRNIFRYYSINPVGLFLAALPYRLQRLKIKLSRALRSNPAMNAILDFKNKLLNR